MADHKKLGDWGPFTMWLNTDGIANLLLIPQCEMDGWVVEMVNGNMNGWMKRRKNWWVMDSWMGGLMDEWR